MPGQELVAFQDEFSARSKLFGDVLAPFHIPVASFRSGAVALFEQQAWLLRSCDIPSVVNAAMSIAVQGLTIDQATGQACIVPFKKRAQAITMVRGFTVIAGRAGFTLQGRLVREGDKIREIGGSDMRIEHEPLIGNKGRIVGAYAVARSNRMPTLFSPFLTIDDIIATRDRSKGYQAAKAENKPHPWITDFEAMAVKTPKRLLAKDIPNDLLHAASWLETQHDLGKVAYLKPDGQGVIEGEATQVNLSEPQPQPEPLGDLQHKKFIIKTPDKTHEFDTIQQWRGAMIQGIKSESPEYVAKVAELNKDIMADLEKGFPADVDVVREAFEDRIGEHLS